MHNYCTLFDSNYLHKGLALYKSLCNVRDEFHLYIVAFDDVCYNALFELKLQNMTVVSMSEFENEELLAVKQTRNRAEYCWTCGPSMIYYFIINYQLNYCTYLDADMMFFSTLDSVYQEIGLNSIAITEHFTEEIDELGGRFCVQFLYFKNDKSGIEALTWWKDQCINWCFARFEDGKYGDQKYLDHFPEKFENVCILKNRGAGVAQWNASQYNFSEFGKIKYKSNTSDIIFYHYHGTRIELETETLVMKTVTYDINNDMKINVYLPYLELIKDVYVDYLNKSVLNIKIIHRSNMEQFYSILKKKFRNFRFIQFLYFKVLKVKYNGYEPPK